jgi:superfamily I DNA and/or RNA helicase
MHPDIAAVVSRAFYNKRVNKETGELQAFDKGWLKSDERTAAQAHGLHAPAFLSGRALIWLDTEGCPDRGDQRPAWKNDGEVEIVRRLLSRVRPAPSTKEEERFALLTPYLRQRDALDKAALPPWAKAHIYSVDSFQGREADIVVVSMVRDTKRGDESPESDIGYLVSPNRVNVMLSRARSLLVIVGRFEHFATLRQRFPDREDIRFWAAVCDEVTSRGARVSAKDTLYGGGDP